MIQSYKTRNWKTSAQKFRSHIEKYQITSQSKREKKLISVKTKTGLTLKLSPGDHNLLQAAVIEKFALYFAVDSELLYLGDTAKKDLFVDDWTTYFSPIYTVYDQYWIDLKTGASRDTRLRIYLFFNPISETSVGLTAFTYMRYPLFAHFGLNLLIKPAIKQIVNLEVLRDKKILEKILDKNPNIAGMKLTRFDRSLGPNRKRIERIYKGNDPVTSNK